MTGVISGTGSYIPATVLDNHHMAQMVETSDEWIRERTGVVRRHIIREENTVTMAVEAGRRALADAGIQPEQLDMILVATISSNVILPCTACEVQRLLGAEHAVCFDLNAACSGFLFAYNTALCYLNSGLYKNILIIGSESLSTLTNWKDRGTCILFGDGAGAAVMTAREGKNYIAVAHSDGKKGSALTCKSRRPESCLMKLEKNAGVQVKNSEPEKAEQNCQFHMPVDTAYMQMNGREVFSFAVKKVPEAIHEVLEANALTAEEIDYFILHQANCRIIEAVSRRMGIGIKKFPMNLQEYGNTSSASIPILLDELHRKGTLKPGQKIVLAGFGAGLSWGASIVNWSI